MPEVRTAADRPRRPSCDVRASHTSPRRSHLAGLANVTAGGGGGSRGGAAVVVTPPCVCLVDRHSVCSFLEFRRSCWFAWIGRSDEVLPGD